MKRMKRSLTLALTLLALGCAAPVTTAADGEGRPATDPPAEGLARATFAGGCFWCMEPPFDKLDGVLSTTSGYTGGPKSAPDLQAGVLRPHRPHARPWRSTTTPRRSATNKLLEVFWRNIDPTVENRQFCDAGTQYRTGIFVHDAEQRRLAEDSLAAIQADPPFQGDIVTPILDAEPFYPAEEYHQDFYEKSPTRYYSYRRGCRRDARLEQLWGDEAGGH